MFKKILIPYDGSEGAKNALKYAAALRADFPELELLAFRSLAGVKDVEMAMGTGREGTGFIDDNTRSHFERVRDKNLTQALEGMEADIAEIAPGAGIECEAAFYPSPVEAILDMVEKHGVDGIVMGSRGVSAIAGMLGSVSFGVIRSADVPVTIVK